MKPLDPKEYWASIALLNPEMYEGIGPSRVVQTFDYTCWSSPVFKNLPIPLVFTEKEYDLVVDALVEHLAPLIVLVNTSRTKIGKMPFKVVKVPSSQFGWFGSSAVKFDPLEEPIHGRVSFSDMVGLFLAGKSINVVDYGDKELVHASVDYIKEAYVGKGIVKSLVVHKSHSFGTHEGNLFLADRYGDLLGNNNIHPSSAELCNTHALTFLDDPRVLIFSSDNVRMSSTLSLGTP